MSVTRDRVWLVAQTVDWEWAALYNRISVLKVHERNGKIFRNSRTVFCNFLLVWGGGCESHLNQKIRECRNVLVPLPGFS